MPADELFLSLLEAGIVVTSTRVKDAKKMGLLAGHAYSLRVLEGGLGLRCCRAPGEAQKPMGSFRVEGRMGQGL